ERGPSGTRGGATCGRGGGRCVPGELARGVAGPDLAGPGGGRREGGRPVLRRAATADRAAGLVVGRTGGGARPAAGPTAPRGEHPDPAEPGPRLLRRPAPAGGDRLPGAPAAGAPPRGAERPEAPGLLRGGLETAQPETVTRSN